MQPSPTELHLPQHFPFPVKVLSLDASRNQYVTRGTRLLTYSFVYLANSPGSLPETRFGTWDSSIEGTLDAWKIKPGEVISRRHAHDKPAVVVLEPCKHGMQLGGLCVVCGKDMTNTDYTGFSDASRASIQMTHSAFGPTVSLEEAQRIERETAEHLFKSRKLSLIVDLDQTIVHATVDPTVGEWIMEGESWEQGRATQSNPDPDATDECPNPNWEALKDVKKFKLGPELFGLPSQVKRNAKAVENEGCMYYIKPRPGWKEFFEDVATKYEMHVYTMGTRAYAEQVCSAIDPEGKLFGGRLLSRDESGSLTQKSLRRLFPCDTSMVVIIDDRADVWEWSPNLVKVIPYEFFIGIGDINSSFLPKIEPITAGSPTQTGEAKPIISTSTTPITTLSPTPQDTEGAEATTNAMIRENTIVLELQLEERPLAKKQTELLQATEQPTSSGHNQQSPCEQKDVKEAAEGTPPLEPSPERKALLKNDDRELDRVSKLLDEVYCRFYAAYEARQRDDDHHRRRKVAYDVTKIIPQMRSEVLTGVHILFSSVIPLDTKPETTEIWRMAHMFGARCSVELHSDITHVVSAKRGTVKVDAARRRGGIKIVWLSWFTDSVALWRRQDETPYLLDEPTTSTTSTTAPMSSPTTGSQQVSSEPEPDTDEFDMEPGQPPGTLGLADIDWNDINDEVEAAMNESDDEEGGEPTSKKVVMASEDEWTDESNSIISERASTPTMKRKRRSVTPSEKKSINGSNDSGEEDALKSPLAKRKKLAAERTGYSRLKEAITADELARAHGMKDMDLKGLSTPKLPEQQMEDGDDGDDEEEEDEDEDDFLARELEEDWG